MALMEQNKPEGFGDAIGQMNNWPQEIVSELAKQQLPYTLGYKSTPTAKCIDPDLPLHNVTTTLGLCTLLGVVSRTNNIDIDLQARVMAQEGLCCLQSDWTYKQCQEVILFLQYKIGTINTNKYLERLQVQDSTVTSKKVQSCINAICHLYRSAAKAKLKGEDLHQQLSSGFTCSESTLSVITNLWKTKGQSLLVCSLTEDKLTIGQLVDLQWKLGMAISSDSCKNLNFPFVIIKLKVSDPSGNLHTYTVEMTLTQFKNFSTQLKEIASVLETV